MDQQPYSTPHSVSSAPQSATQPLDTDTPQPSGPSFPEKSHPNAFQQPSQPNIQVPNCDAPQKPRGSVQDNAAWAQPRPDQPESAAPGMYAPPQSYIPQQSLYVNEWTSQIFDCLNPSNLCITACICPCFVFGKTQARLRDPTLRTYDPINQECFVWAVSSVCGLNGIYQCLTRREIRNIFKIKGDDIEDGVMSCCCTCCALVQQEKEVVTRWQHIDTRGYVRQPDMQMR